MWVLLPTTLGHIRYLEPLECSLHNPLAVPEGKVLAESSSVTVYAKDNTDIFQIYHSGYGEHSHSWLLLYAVFQVIYEVLIWVQDFTTS